MTERTDILEEIKLAREKMTRKEMECILKDRHDAPIYRTYLAALQGICANPSVYLDGAHDAHGFALDICIISMGMDVAATDVPF